MNTSRVLLDSWGAFPGGSGGIETRTVDVDLGQPTNFLAWSALTYLGGRIGDGASSGPWDFDNGAAVEIFMVDGLALTELGGFGSRFGPENAFDNYHNGAFSGFGQVITFRFRIYQPEEMEGFAIGVVLSSF